MAALEHAHGDGDGQEDNDDQHHADDQNEEGPGFNSGSGSGRCRRLCKAEHIKVSPRHIIVPVNRKEENNKMVA